MTICQNNGIKALTAVDSFHLQNVAIKENLKRE